MAVLIEAISVVVRKDSIVNHFPDGWNGFMDIVPNRTLCADGEIIRIGFMTPQDVGSFVEKLKSHGLEFVRDGEAVEIAVVDQMRGPTTKCSWLEYGHVSMDGTGPRVAACRLAGSQSMDVVAPEGWVFEESLSSRAGFVPSEHIEKGLKFLRHEEGLDVYFNPLTGKEVYVGRTGK